MSGNAWPARLEALGADLASEVPQRAQRGAVEGPEALPGGWDPPARKPAEPDGERPLKGVAPCDEYYRF